eukprot:s1328_g3.t3
MERLSQQVLRRCPEHDPQNCANTMRAHGVPVVGGSPVIAASSKRATEVISEFACQSLANTGWSLTNSSATGDELLSSAEARAKGQLVLELSRLRGSSRKSHQPLRLVGPFGEGTAGILHGAVGFLLGLCLPRGQL